MRNKSAQEMQRNARTLDNDDRHQIIIKILKQYIYICIYKYDLEYI